MPYNRSPALSLMRVRGIVVSNRSAGYSLQLADELAEDATHTL